MKTLERVQDIFRDIFDMKDLNVSRTTSAANIEEWDSLTHISLVVGIEKEFGIKFALGELQALQNVGDMIDLIEKKTQK